MFKTSCYYNNVLSVLVCVNVHHAWQSSHFVCKKKVVTLRGFTEDEDAELCAPKIHTPLNSNMFKVYFHSDNHSSPVQH